MAGWSRASMGSSLYLVGFAIEADCLISESVANSAALLHEALH